MLERVQAAFAIIVLICTGIVAIACTYYLVAKVIVELRA